MRRLLWAAIALPLIGAEAGSEKVGSVHEAIERSDFEAAIELLPLEHDMEARNQAGDTLLCAALLNPDPKAHRIVRDILDRGADANAECSNLNTPLNQAIAIGSYAAIDLLLERGADVNGRNPEEGSLKPMAYAYLMGHPDIAQYLQERGGTVLEGVRVAAQKAQAQMDYYVNGGWDIPPGLSPLERVHRMWEVRVGAIEAATEHETNIHQIRLERLWVKKALRMKYDPGSGMHQSDWMDWALETALDESNEELRGSGTWRDDELPDTGLLDR